MGKQPELAACNELPKSMQEWKEAIEKGAAAAVEVYESLDGVMNGDGGLEHSLYGLTRDGLLAVDARRTLRRAGVLPELQPDRSRLAAKAKWQGCGS